MASNFQMQPFFRTPLTVDTTQAQSFYRDDEDASILDDAVLDQSAVDSGLEMSPPMANSSRRDSFAVSSTLFSPKTEADWQSVDMQSVPSNNPFLDPHSGDAYMHGQQQQQQQQQQQPQQQQQQAFATGPWPAVGSSGAATPLHAFEGVPAADYEPSVSMFQRPAPAMPPGQTPFSNPNNQVPMFSHATSQDAKGLAAAAAAALRRDRVPASLSLLPSHNELRRGDGIRKKNARFEIPPERNLNNIDMLISQSQDEQEIKELKQQKRLLRNRQAALDSRQRKKQHTERLEDEKKQFTEAMSAMQEDMSHLQHDFDQLLREKVYFEEYAMELERQKAEMLSQHTIEAGELRKKLHVLTSHIQSLERSTAMPDQQPIQGQFLPHPMHQPFPGPDFGDLDDLAGLDVPWTGLSFADFQPDPTEARPSQTTEEIKQELQHVSLKKGELPTPTTTTTTATTATTATSLSTATDLSRSSATQVPVPAPAPASPPQGGLLFMLFLVGAFVLSRSTPPSIPRVSDDVRAASATLLESVLRDAGATATTSDEGVALITSAPAAWPSPTATDGVISASTAQPSMLGRMTDALTQPTAQQANEQLFGLSAEQYNGVVGGNGAYHCVPPSQQQQQQQPRSTSQGRRNLAEALESMQAGKAGSVADVYTRSLLWDQIPSDVVRDFARMVAESSRTASAEGDGNV